jgi:hypothetical protein
METGIIEIIFLNGRKFNVFFENKAQKEKVLKLSNRYLIVSMRIIVNGIHKANYFLSKIDSIQKANKI